MEEFLKEIKKISKSKSEIEICGFLLKKNKKILIKDCENIAIDKTCNFQISSKDYIDAWEQAEIIAIYHSHPKSSEKLSEIDISIADEMMIPIIVYSNKNNRFNIFTPEGINKNKTLKDLEKSVVLSVKG